jgi:hypothetical protein
MSTPDGQVNTGTAYENGEPRRVPGVPYFDAFQIGTMVWQAGRGQGNRYKGRTEIYGVGDSHCELLMVPGPDFKGPGVSTQVMMMTNGRPGIEESQQRLSIAINRQSNLPDGSQGPDIAMIDLDSHSKAKSLNLFVMTGGITMPDDSPIVGRLALQLSGDGTLEVWDMRDSGEVDDQGKPILDKEGQPVRRRVRIDLAAELVRLGAVSG